VSAPLLWIILPGVFAVFLFMVRGFPRLMRGVGIFFSAWLWLAALLLPIGDLVTLGRRAIILSESLSFLGREFIFMDTDRPFLALLFFFHLAWLIGSWAARPQEAFIPFSFAIVALLTAALAVEPFLYAALLIEIAVLIAVPLLSPPGQLPGKGIFRFLAFQTLGMPFILISGRFLAGLEASPGQTELVLRAGVLIGIGFAFLLAAVPFHSWIPPLAEESQPYTVGFILFLLPVLISLFGLGFIDRFIWLREAPEVYLGLRLIGGIMVVVGGVWAAVETHLGRMMGYAAISETGISLMAVSIGGREGVILYFWMIVVRLFSVVPWAAALSNIKHGNNGELWLDKLRGAGHKFPLSAAALVVANFSLIGIPFLAGFSAKFAFWRQLSAAAPFAAGIALVGTVGLGLGALRTLNALYAPLPDQDSTGIDPTAGILDQGGNIVSERLLEWVLFGLYVVMIGVIGIFPKLYLPWFEQILFIFDQLGRG
jgi:formate hydrogenlyase subunit 3/multisubunit Na+/H+ antiporter MnhD subunit